MFTGIVETLGQVAELKPMAGGYRVRLQTELASELKPGDSVAVNGACLTVILSDRGEIHADVSPETTRVTTLGGLQRGQHVNLERPIRANARLDGHIVQGHVDGVGIVDDVRPDADCHWLTVSFPSQLAAYFIRKGSVAVDGVSLTVAGLGEREFDVQIIPFTLKVTTLRSLRPGDKVNIECDLVGKYVLRALEVGGPVLARKP